MQEYLYLWLIEKKTTIRINNTDLFLSPLHFCRAQFEIVHEVCVFDLDRPWEEFKVTTVAVPVVYMRWDPSGMKLLIVNSEGTFTVWAMEVSIFSKSLKSALSRQLFQIRVSNFGMI